MLRYTRCNIVTLMAATPPPSRGGGEIFSGDTLKVRYTNQIHTRHRNWRTTSGTQLQPSKSLCYIRYTSTWWQHDCWLTVQTLYAICILTPERISQGHVQNGRQAIFSWPTLYNVMTAAAPLYESESWGLPKNKQKWKRCIFWEQLPDTDSLHKVTLHILECNCKYLALIHKKNIKTPHSGGRVRMEGVWKQSTENNADQRKIKKKTERKS